jgi:hypothetical protein
MKFKAGDKVVYIGPRNDMQGIIYTVHSCSHNFVQLEEVGFVFVLRHVKLATPLDELL